MIGTGGNGSGGSARHSGPKHHSGAAPKHQSSNPATGNPAAGIPGLPPPGQAEPLGQTNYAEARSLCSDPMVLNIVPKSMQGNPEALAQLYASYFQPQDRQAAYAGCLAGLHQLGL